MTIYFTNMQFAFHIYKSYYNLVTRLWLYYWTVYCHSGLIVKKENV